MKKQEYKDHNNKNYRIILIVIFVMVFILFISKIALNKLENELEQSEISYDNLSTMKEVVEYHKSKYISENFSEDDGIYLDVFVKFKVPLYQDDISNEEYYNILLEDAAKIIYYRSFNMIDKEQDINVKVICENGKIKRIIINDMEDYFIYHDSQISMKNYVEIENTEFTIASELLNMCINNDWRTENIYFGERESIFDEYYIYFDEGIKVRTINGKIYNIIFTKKYNGNVINNIFPGLELRNIKSSLGKPTFENENVIGYKGDKCYVFFTDTEISVYRNSYVETDEFFNLADEFIENNIDFLEFMNQLTYIWPDYSEYNYNSTSVFISYPLKGIEIALNNGDINGILVYNNNKSTMSKIRRYLENTNFVGRLQVDSVFEAEKRRIEKQIDLGNKCDNYIEELDEDIKDIIGESFNYKIFAKKDDNGYIYEMNFISKDNEHPNRQLTDRMDYYLWLNNDYFLYSKANKGIFFYNLNTGRVQRVLTGTEEYKLIDYENGILRYDDNAIQLQF